MSRVNFRLLVERVEALEAEVAALKAAQPEVRYEQGEPAAPRGSKFIVESRGPKWFCISPEGVRVNERGMSKEDAQKLADDMNGVTKSMAAA